MKTILLFVLVALSSLLQAQTKVIAFKSHSLHMEHFLTALEDPTHNLSAHNLGAAPQPFIKTAVLDSVIFINDSAAIMVTSEYCQKNPWYSSRPALDVPSGKTLWTSGSDTVYHHPLFTQQHALDSIKTELKHHYYFRESIDSTVFVGYDNKRPVQKLNRKQKKSSVPVIITPTGTGGTITGFLLVGILLVAAIVSFWSFRLQRQGQYQL